MIVRTAAAVASTIIAWIAIGSTPPARATSGNSSAAIGGFIGAVFGELLAHHINVRADQRAEAQLRRNRLTVSDEANLKELATSLEEYAVDHNGQYPGHLTDLTPTYLRGAIWVPGSDPPAQYSYENPASRPEWGKWDLVDDGSLDPTLDNLRALDNSVCTHATCRHIVYAESSGLVGAP